MKHYFLRSDLTQSQERRVLLTHLLGFLNDVTHFLSETLGTVKGTHPSLRDIQ